MKKSREHKLSMKRAKRTRVAMATVLSRLSEVVQPGDIKYLYDDEKRKEKIFSVRGPITDQPITFRVSTEAWHHKLITPEMASVVDYVDAASMVMERARDEQPFNDDIRPWSEEERRKFGVKVGKNNPCIPVSKGFRGIDRAFW